MRSLCINLGDAALFVYLNEDITQCLLAQANSSRSVEFSESGLKEGKNMKIAVDWAETERSSNTQRVGIENVFIMR